MCVIIYKSIKKKKLPSENIIQACWEHNPHGAGVMWKWEWKDRVNFVKGFTDLPQLQDWLYRSREALEGNRCEVAIHFRITTHGGTSAGNTHPFVIERDADPHELQGCAPYVLMHNGVMPLKPRQTDYSDSAELALRAAESRDPVGFLEKIDEFLEQNRVLVFTPDGARFFGDAFVKGKGGYLYSNLNHEYVAPTNYYGGSLLRGYNGTRHELEEDCEYCGMPKTGCRWARTPYGILRLCPECRKLIEEEEQREKELREYREKHQKEHAEEVK